MPERKYTSEFGLNVMATNLMLLQQSELSRVKDAPFIPYVYIIGSRPRISVVPDSFQFGAATIKGIFRKQIQDHYEPIEAVTRNLLGTTDLTMQAEFPYSDFSINDSAGTPVLWGRAPLLLAQCGAKYWEHLDLEVLYVGQAYGEGGSRNAADRLASHSTLQHIYSEANRRSPDKETWLVLLGFETIIMTSIDGRTEPTEESEERDRLHRQRFYSNQGVSESQTINFTEAALIKYFSAPYNKQYRDTFPNPAHANYSECYDLDLNSVSVELQTEELGLRLWSQTVKPKWIHHCQFPLNSTELRKDMFEL